MLAFRYSCVFCVYLGKRQLTAPFSAGSRKTTAFLNCLMLFIITLKSCLRISTHRRNAKEKTKKKKKWRSNEAHTIQTHGQCRQSIANICVFLRCMVIGNETTKYDCVLGIARSSFATKIRFTPKTLLYWMSTSDYQCIVCFYVLFALFAAECFSNKGVNMRI